MADWPCNVLCPAYRSWHWSGTMPVSVPCICHSPLWGLQQSSVLVTRLGHPILPPPQLAPRQCASGSRGGPLAWGRPSVWLSRSGHELV